VIDVVAGLQAHGMTALHDALVTSLYYCRAVRGQRALVLLSDGDDTASGIAFRDALEYARRSGVAIYTVGLAGQLKGPVRGKLDQLAGETGGRSFYIERAEELAGVYAEIEEELRSRYLLAYNSDRPPGAPDDRAFREVEVQVRGRGLKARTLRGYYP
jgi:VWFA-related protein